MLIITLKLTKQVGPTPESTSILKCILGPKRFWVKKSVRSQKNLALKNFGPKMFWVQKISKFQRNVGQKIFGSLQILVPKKFGVEKILVPKNFESERS